MANLDHAIPKEEGKKYREELERKRHDRRYDDSNDDHYYEDRYRSRYDPYDYYDDRAYEERYSGRYEPYPASGESTCMPSYSQLLAILNPCICCVYICVCAMVGIEYPLAYRRHPAAADRQYHEDRPRMDPGYRAMPPDRRPERCVRTFLPVPGGGGGGLRE